MPKLLKSSILLLKSSWLKSVIAALETDGLLIPHIERINNLWQDIKFSVYKLRRFWCESLKSPSKMRLIFAYDEKTNEIQLLQFLEIYAKADKPI